MPRRRGNAAAPPPPRPPDTRQPLPPLQGLQVRVSLLSALGLDVRTFEVEFSARLGEQYAPGHLYCGYCNDWHHRSSFSAQQCGKGHGLRYCLIFSQRVLPHHHELPSPDACYRLWHAGLSENGKRLLSASHGNSVQARDSHHPSPKPTARPERAKTLPRPSCRSRHGGTPTTRTRRSGQLVRR